jgi:hypothetical protein
MKINEFGIRSGNESFRPVPTRPRVTVVGDSFVFSEGISDGERFTDELQRLLGPDCEVVNASVPGYGTGQEFLLVEKLRTRGVDLGEVVLHVFFTNDTSDNAGLAYESLERDPQKPVFEVDAGELRHSPPTPWQPIPVDAIAADLGRQSLLLALLRQRIGILAASHPSLLTTFASAGARVQLPRTPGVILAWYAPGWEERWGRTRDVLRHFARRVENEGSEFLIAFMPSPFQVEKVFEEIARAHAGESYYADFLTDIDRPQRELLGFCIEDRLHCIDLTPALREPRGESAFFLQEGHLNAFGSTLVAKRLYASLRTRCHGPPDRGALPEPPSFRRRDTAADTR